MPIDTKVEIKYDDRKGLVFEKKKEKEVYPEKEKLNENSDNEQIQSE